MQPIRKLVEMRAAAHLKPFPNNARTHSAEQIEQIAASIRKFGFTNPVLITAEGMIVAGHGRVAAAILIGMIEIPTMIVGEDWSPDDLRAYVLADNQLALNAGWDEDLLQVELQELSNAGFDLGLVGFDDATISRLLEGETAEAGAAAPSISLAERFGIVPFSVFNAREGWWQNRKRAWLALGIKSELGRGENALGFSETILQPGPHKRTPREKRGAA